MADVRALLLDISGVLYEDSEPVAGAVDAVNRVQRSGMPLALVTNSSKRTSEAIYYDLRQMGFQLEPEQLHTAPGVIRAFLKQRALRPYCLIHEQLEAEFADVSDRHQPNAVVVCDAEKRFDYAHLDRAFQILLDGAPLIAVGDNRYYRSRGKLHLDAGPFIRALEYAADCRAIVLGKPAAQFFATVVAELGVPVENALMVGDDVQADVLGAMNAGLQACLVKTGKYRDGDEGHAVGARVAANLAEVVEQCL